MLANSGWGGGGGMTCTVVFIYHGQGVMLTQVHSDLRIKAVIRHAMPLISMSATYGGLRPQYSIGGTMRKSPGISTKNDTADAM